VIDHPAARSVLVLVVAVAEIVGTDRAAEQPDGQQRPPGRGVPPRKDHLEKRHAGLVRIRPDYRAGAALAPMPQSAGGRFFTYPQRLQSRLRACGKRDAKNISAA